MSYHEIVRGKVPWWYRLGLTPTGQLSIKIVPECWSGIVPRLQAHSNEVPDRSRKVRFTLPNFIPVTEPAWGHGPVITTAYPAHQEFVELTCDWPMTKGLAHGDSQLAQFSVSKTLEALVRALLIWDGVSASRYPQLAVINGWTVESDTYGGGISVMLSRELCDWLRTPEEVSLPEIEEGMMRTYLLMPIEDVFTPYRHEFRAEVNSLGLHLTIPGDACGLDPELTMFPNEPGRGYPLSPHNTDTPRQQLTLLAGLAVLCDLYHKVRDE